MSQGLATFQSGIRQWFVRGGAVTTPIAPSDTDSTDSSATSAGVASVTVNDGTATGDLRTFQSTFKQQFIREGGGIDLTTGVAIDPASAGSSSSSDGGQLPGEPSTYRIHHYAVDGQTLNFGTVYVGNGANGTPTENWTWQVTIQGSINSQWVIVVESDTGQLVKAMNYTGVGYAEDLLWYFTTASTKPLWHVNRSANETAVNDDTGQAFFNYIPNTGQ